MTLDEALAETPIVAIIRGVTPEEAVATAEALYEAGVRVVEVPMNSPQPLGSISRLAKAVGGKMVCGAGTVLRAAAVERAHGAGARFVVAPNTDEAVIQRAIGLRLTAMPGFGTATEAFRALHAGARHLKLFPASTYGAGHVKALGAVLPPDTMVLAVGGVGAGAMAEWWAAGVRGFGLGSELYKAGQSPEETHTKAKAAVAAARALG